MANERKNEKKLEILAVLLVLQHRSYTELGKENDCIVLCPYTG
jgi:hypothetical protein